MERKYVVKSKIIKYPFICDMILGFCAVYLVSALFLVETDKWIESENIIKVIFFIGAILYGIYTCVKRLINYKIIAVTEKDFTIIKPFLFKSKTYLKRYIKEVVLDDTNMGKTIFVDAKIIILFYKFQKIHRLLKSQLPLPLSNQLYLFLKPGI